MARDKLVHFYGRGKGKGLVWVVMEGGGELCQPATPNVHVFNEGDMVHVFEGTGAGNVRSRDVGWFGKVVGRDGDVYLVRNRILTAKGRPNRVSAQYIKKQVDFGLQGASEDRVHFRNLSKRTRDRIMQSSDERNQWEAKDAQKELLKLKKQKTLEKEAYLQRREQIETQGTTALDQSRYKFEQQVKYWQDKCDVLKQKLKTNTDNHKRTIQEVKVVLFISSVIFYLY